MEVNIRPVENGYLLTQITRTTKTETFFTTADGAIARALERLKDE